MDRKWSWAFWRRDGNERSEHARPAAGAPHDLDSWEARLVEEGVSLEWAARLAQRLAPLQRELGIASSESLIRGAVAAVEIQAEAQAHVERNMRDVREVERLLGAFSGELEKLDEVLEVLAAYAQRMRAQPNRGPRHTLH